MKNQRNDKAERHGYWEGHYSNGNLVYTGHYINGVMVGLFKFFEPTGNLIEKEFYL
jgi:antitoxin component YwqK of YwqJK toxin-antitoxin module